MGAMVRRFKVIRKLNKFKHQGTAQMTHQVNIPGAMIGRLGWQRGDKVHVIQHKDEIVLRRVPTREEYEHGVRVSVDGVGGEA